jgi:hypothetical protein
MLVVDPHHWLDTNGDLPVDNTRLRRQALRVVRIIEYGGPLLPRHMRETLIGCSKRPGGKPCLGLLWVTKTADDMIDATCTVCGNTEMTIHNWRDTQWADGMMPPVAVSPGSAVRSGTGPLQAN